MHDEAKFRITIFSMSPGATVAALAIALTFALTIGLIQPLQAQTSKVLYNFTSGRDGGVPGSLLIDKAGNLYGTTVDGGDGGDLCVSTPCGTVFKLSNNGSGWVLTTLHSFTGNPNGDGAVPTGITFGATGNLYGTTEFGGGTQQACGGCGTVFKLGPPSTACRTAPCDWTETVLYRFSGGDGNAPLGSPAFDPSGNLFGTSFFGGSGGCSGGCGLVWELTPSPAGWRESVPYRFNGTDGATPIAGVTISPSGNLYGTTTGGGRYGYGAVFQLIPSGSGWSLNALYSFQGAADGAPPFPISSLVLDNLGNLYGSTLSGGSRQGGMVFELTNGSWTFSELYSFDGPSYPFSGPDGNLFMDNRGNLYGVTEKEGGAGCGGYGCGTVFKLTPGAGGWTYTLLHSFSDYDGSYPSGNLVFDVNGNLYGTTEYGGAYGRGVVFEITP
jgi:uncharacterized repeat protein (TIGR03803 family)